MLDKSGAICYNTIRKRKEKETEKMNETYFYDGHNFLFEGDFEKAVEAFRPLWEAQHYEALEETIEQAKLQGYKGLGVYDYTNKVECELGWA